MISGQACRFTRIDVEGHVRELTCHRPPVPNLPLCRRPSELRCLHARPCAQALYNEAHVAFRAFEVRRGRRGRTTRSLPAMPTLTHRTAWQVLLPWMLHGCPEPQPRVRLIRYYGTKGSQGKENRIDVWHASEYVSTPDHLARRRECECACATSYR